MSVLESLKDFWHCKHLRDLSPECVWRRFLNQLTVWMIFDISPEWLSSLNNDRKTFDISFQTEVSSLYEFIDVFWDEMTDQNILDTLNYCGVLKVLRHLEHLKKEFSPVYILWHLQAIKKFLCHKSLTDWRTLDIEEYITTWKILDISNHLRFLSHTYFEMLRCVLRILDWLKDLGHRSHLKGPSPVCVRRWRFKSP